MTEGNASSRSGRRARGGRRHRIAAPVKSRNALRELADDDRPVADRSADLPKRIRLEELDERADGRHVGVVDHEKTAHAKPGSNVPPIEDRIRKPVRSVDQREIEPSRLERRDDLV